MMLVIIESAKSDGIHTVRWFSRLPLSQTEESVLKAQIPERFKIVVKKSDIEGYVEIQGLEPVTGLHGTYGSCD